jgi:hypothetical protein
VYAFFFVVVVLSCVGRGLATGRSPVKDSSQMSKNSFISFKSQILNWNRPEGLIRIYSTVVPEYSNYDTFPDELLTIFILFLLSPAYICT